MSLTFGNLSVSVRLDKRITGALNVHGARLKSAGKVNNSANIGKGTEEIVYMWNEEQPEDMALSGTEPEPNPF